MLLFCSRFAVRSAAGAIGRVSSRCPQGSGYRRGSDARYCSTRLSKMTAPTNVMTTPANNMTRSNA
jgi:hypothetical protein